MPDPRRWKASGEKGQGFLPLESVDVSGPLGRNSFSAEGNSGGIRGALPAIPCAPFGLTVDLAAQALLGGLHPLGPYGMIPAGPKAVVQEGLAACPCLHSRV